MRAGEARAAERPGRLWMLAASPGIWAAHFLLSYATAALWCGKVAGLVGPLATARLAIAGYTVVALAAIAVIGFVGLSDHRSGSASLPHDDDTPEDRRRFLGFATLLLSGLSAVAVIYSALAAVVIETCQ